jgi:hypothetical protein
MSIAANARLKMPRHWCWCGQPPSEAIRDSLHQSRVQPDGTLGQCDAVFAVTGAVPERDAGSDQAVVGAQ